MPVIHGYVREGHHVMCYSCINQTKSLVSMRARVPCHLLSLSRPFLEDLDALYKDCYQMLCEEAQAQEESLHASHESKTLGRDASSESKTVYQDVFKAVLCLDYKPTSFANFKKNGYLELKQDRASRDAGNLIRTRRDNLEDQLECRGALLARGIVDPKMPKKMGWDFFIGLLIIYSFLMLPYITAFPSTIVCCELDAQRTLDWIVDCLFMVDIVVHFRTAVYDDSAQVYDTRPSAIAKRYLPGWFLIDLPSSLPMNQILEAAHSSCGDDNNNKSAKFLKLIRMGRLVRLAKIARIFKLGKSVGAGFDMLEVGLAFRHFLSLTFTLCVIAHYFGCGWHLVKQNVFSGDALVQDLSNPAEFRSPFSPDYAYVSGLYWAFNTMTTVGYGDITPETLVEQIYAMVVMLCGATIA